MPSWWITPMAWCGWRCKGACSGCPSADVTTRLFIEQTLQAALPDEIKKVELTQMVDPELLAFAKKVSECNPNNKI